MKIKQLHLQNYGRFEDLTIDFAPTAERQSNVTVIVGNNGAGKSQILQALATSLSWFSSYLKNGKEKGSSINHEFIKNDKNDASLEITVDFENNNYVSLFNSNSYSQWQISAVRDGRINSFKNNFSELESVVSKYRNHLTNDNSFSLPLLVFYPAERSVLGFASADLLPGRSERFKGYYVSLNGSGIDFSEFLSWFRECEDIENEHSRKIERLAVKEMEESDRIIQLTLNLLNNYKEKPDDNLEKFNRNELAERVKKLAILREKGRFELKNGIKVADKKLLGVKQSIEKFTGFNNLRISRKDTPTMIVEKDGEELDINQLSQGEKSLLALIGDIARRLAILNPGLDNPLESKGVVMIDEVDLHLHPKWQHDLIDKLVTTFPNVQFILTTHSPHVISDRNDILLYSLDDGELTQMPNVYGEDVNTVLSKIMDVDIRDSEVEKQFTEIRRAISKREYQIAEEKINDLSEQLPPDNLELLKCRLMLAQAKLVNSDNANHATN